MNDPRTEDLLRRLAELDPAGASAPPPGDPPDEATLAAYREGSLEPAVALRVERWLAASPALRERLAALAEVELPAPPRRIRDRWLADATSTNAGGRLRLPSSWLAAAAVILAAVGLLVLLARFDSPRRGGEGAALPEFTVVARGIAPVRGPSGEAARRTVEARPGTPVRVTITAEAAVGAGLDYALYRLRDRDAGRLERVDLDPRAERRLHRGAAELVLPAELLVASGRAPESSFFWVAVAPEGRLPSELTAGDDPRASLAAASGGRVYRIALRFRPADADPEEPRDTPPGRPTTPEIPRSPR